MRLFKREDIRGQIAKVGDDAGKLQDRIHRLAISIMVEWANDPTYGPEAAELVTDLAKASPYHGNAFAKWVNDLTPFTWSKEKEVFFVHKDQKLSLDKLNTIRTGKTFYEYKPAGQIKPLNDIEELERLLARIRKRNEKPVDGDVIHSNLWRGVTTLLQEVKAAEAA